MQSPRGRHPHIRAVRREIAPPPPPPPARRGGARLGALLLVAALLGGGWYLLQQRGAPQQAPKVVAVRKGAVESVVEVDALIARREQVVTAPVGGLVKRLATEGERVRVGTAVVEIDPAVTESANPPPTSTAPPTGAGTTPTRGMSSAAQREYDRLAEEIFQLVSAYNKAFYGGDWARAESLDEQLDRLGARQAALVAQWYPATTREPEPSATQPNRRGQLIDPSPDATPVSAKGSGVVLYQVDGLEGALNLADTEHWSPSWVRALPYPAQQAGSNGVVGAGQPLFKVVDDLDLDLIAIIPSSRLTPAQRTLMQEGGVAVKIAGRERAVTARVRRMVEEGEELLLHLTVPVPATDALKLRRIRISLLLESYEGVVVPRSAIDVEGGVTGVWLFAHQKYSFIPVRVVGGNQAEVAVLGDLPPDAEILIAPAEGRPPESKRR